MMSRYIGPYGCCVISGEESLLVGAGIEEIGCFKSLWARLSFSMIEYIFY